MDVAAGTGMVGPEAYLLPGHTDHPVGGHAAADPVVTSAIVARCGRGRLGCQHGARGESFGGGGHVQGLVRTGVVVVVDPFIEGLLGGLEVGERLMRAEEFSAQAAVEPLDFPGSWSGFAVGSADARCRAAAGDALGAAYGFGPPRGPELEVAMVGGGSFGWEPGEWTDDTSMAIAITEVAATGADLRQEEALDAIAQRWHEWSQHAKDVGVQTRSVLSRAGRHGISAQTAREESAALHKLTGRTAGNGSLMRTAPVALAYLDDEAALVEAARAVSELTHYDPDAGDACVLWCCAIRHAILTGCIGCPNRTAAHPLRAAWHVGIEARCR